MILHVLSQRNNLGFTLIELIIVLSVIAILSLIGIASFVSFGKRQVVQNAQLDLVNMLQVAKLRTLSQVKPADTCTGIFKGYSVEIVAQDTYQLSVLCGEIKTPVMTKQNKAVEFSPNADFTFQPITGSVTSLSSDSTTIEVKYANDATIMKTVSVYKDGRVTYN